VPESQPPILHYEQPAHPRFGDRIPQGPGRQAADLPEHGPIQASPQHGCCFDHAAGRRAQPSQPPGNDIGVAHRPRTSRDAHQILHQQRKAPRVPAQARQDRLRSGIQAQARSGHRRDLAVSQRREVQMRGVTAQRPARPGRSRLIRACGQHNRHPERGDMISQIPQHRQRLAVCPVHVLQHQDSTPAGRQPAQNPQYRLAKHNR
jgi:hypothetical protein